MSITISCLTCNTIFSTPDKRRKYCSYECSREALRTRKPIPCLICNTPFIPVPVTGGGKTKTCSMSCGGIYKSRKTPSPEILFWRDVDKKGIDDCWEWKGARAGGYGVFSISTKQVRAHRFSYELHKGPIPEGMVVMHSCDNPPCVNPKHLSIGTCLENVRDCINKGRRVFGHSHLSLEIAQEIRTLYATGAHTHTSLAQQFHTSQSNIGRIVNNKMWHK